MSLNRAQKRNLALLLVGQAKTIIADWQNVSSKRFNEIDDGAFDGVSQEDVRDIYHQWLKYLPHDAWNKVDEPDATRTPSESGSEAGPETRGNTTLDGDGSATTSSGTYASEANYGGGVEAAESYDPKAESEGIGEHVNPAISDETPVMGSNEIVHENVVLKGEDDDPTGDKAVVGQSSASGPQPFLR